MTADNGGRCGEPELSDSLKTFGVVLKALRDEAGLTQEEFAPLVDYSAHYIAKIEQGKRFPPRDLVTRSEAALGATAGRVLKAAAKSLTRKPGLASWFRQWAEIEEDAVSLYAYECRVVPGLLQPESYVRAVCGSRLPPLTDDQLEVQVAARLERQRLLKEKGNTAFGFVVEQSLIERQTGGVDTTRDLIDHVIACAQLRNVEVQIMPLRRKDHAGLDGALYLAEMAGNQWFGYFEGHDHSALVTRTEHISGLLQRYGKMRSQALGLEASIDLLEQLRGAL
ncbi:helix-turn-helix transcriptional regulator [Embleya sp. NPDC005575]|uniref:helix-turn-helix domain-containing protein n=1 Tax=Embleya sp. NPDC005575 TaxID=3156892 RepID=UPI0033B6F1F1